MLYEKTCAGLPGLLRKSMIALTLLIALCVTSCKTVQKASQTVQYQQSEQTNDIQQQSALDANAVTLVLSSDTSTTETVVDEVIEETTWSDPDENGKQHPVTSKRTNRTTRTGKQNHVQTKQEASSALHASENVQDNTKQKESNLQEEDTTLKTKTSTPAWIIVLIVGVLCVVLIVILVILKHYRIL